MSKKIIYLSRHGKTERNALTAETGRVCMPEWENQPGLDDLNAEGMSQLITFANYLKQKVFMPKRISPSNILVITSTDNRSADSGDIVRCALGIPAYNTLRFSTLCEEVPREYFMGLNPDDPSRRLMDSAKSKDEIGCDVLLTLEMIAEQEPHRHIIAPLHGCVNMLFLHYAGLGARDMGNCSLITLEYDGKKFRVIDGYRTNEEMERAVRTRGFGEAALPDEI